MVSSTEGWAVGSGGAIIRWDGSNWSNVTSPTTQSLQWVFMVSATDGWAVGHGGTIIRWNGSNWLPEFPATMIAPLLISLTLVAVIITKKRQVSYKTR
jgi:photosystem II stability/assembly factor-like uncharacterized protein